MSLDYIDIHEMEVRFRSYNLDINNILQFMVSNANDDKYKRMLRLYLCSLLESYKHIDYLRALFCLVYNKEFIEGEEFIDIISSNIDSSFWKSVLKDRCVFDSDALISWINRHFSDYFKYFELDSENNLVFIGGKDDDFEFVTLVRRFEQCVGSNISPEAFNNFVNVVICNIKKKYGEMDEWELEIEFKAFCEELFCEDYISLLINDLVFNYQMILSLFSRNLVRANNLFDVLGTIRNLFYRNAKEFLDYSGLELVDLNDEYRDFQCDGDGSFWEKTPNFDDVPEMMNQLSKKFQVVCDEKDDSAYVLKAFELSQELLQIHPYRNGNGRTSKYLLFLLMVRRNLLPITMTDGHYLPECYCRMQELSDNNEAVSRYFRYRQEVMRRRVK